MTGAQSELDGEQLLQQMRPAFLDQLDSTPEVAYEAFYQFAIKLLTVSPPGPLRVVPLDDRMDLIHDVVIHCCANDFRVLRRYEARGRPFVAWFRFVARNRIIDALRSRQPGDKFLADDAQELIEKTRPDPGPLPDTGVWAEEILDAVARCLGKLGELCRLLVEGAADGLRPRELTRLLGWPTDWNKKASDDLRACRKRLTQLLREEGIEPADLPAAVRMPHRKETF